MLEVHSTDGPVPVTAAAQKGPRSSCHLRSGNMESVAEHKTYAVTEVSALQEKLAIKYVATTHIKRKALC